jgi:perosamine synthetase
MTSEKIRLVIDGGRRRFDKDLSRLDPLPANIAHPVLEVLHSGRLFRYACQDPASSEVSLLEKEFAEYVGSRYAIAFNSCSSAMFVALSCVGVRPGDEVLMPAFTFTAVPSTVLHAHAVPRFVECDEDYRLDLDDLRRKTPGRGGVLLLSHMRGNVSDLDAIVEICSERNITLIEDAAHSLGAYWSGRHTGTFGRAGSFSFQSHKMVNAGEGGMLVTDDEELAARAILYSGAFEKSWNRHFIDSPMLTELQGRLPTYNLRMSELTAAVARPQLPLIERKAELLRKNYQSLADILGGHRRIRLPRQYPQERPAPDHVQFRLIDLNPSEVNRFVELIRLEGINLHAYGVDVGNARAFWNWKYLEHIEDLPVTRAVLENSCDMRLPVALSRSDVEVIGELIIDVVDHVISRRPGRR